MTQKSYELYFEKNPLSAEEREDGSALRLVRCTRSTRTSLSWVLLYAKKGSIGESDVPHPIGVAHVFLKKAQLFSGEAFSLTLLDNTKWQVKEFEFVTPYFSPSFSLVCGSAKCRISSSERKKMLTPYWQSINHAARCKAYEQWANKNKAERLSRSERDLTIQPLMSIVTPVYKTPPHLLREMLQSVQDQTYSNWEHIIVNASPEDKAVEEILSTLPKERVTIVTMKENEGIVGNTNAGVKVAKGDFVSFLDHDDLLEHDILYRYVEVIQEHDSVVDLIYCDEDSIDEKGTLNAPRFKPPINLDFLYSNNYVLHLLTVSRYVLDRIQLSNKEVEGAQDFDLTLKAVEIARNTVRVPELLYHWRSHKGSTNSNPDSKSYSDIAGQRSIEGHFERCNINARVSSAKSIFTYRSDFCLPEGSPPSVTCIIPNTSIPPALKTSISEYESIVVDSHLIEVVCCKDASIATYNEAISQAKGELILFLSDNIQGLSERFLQTLIGYFQRNEVAVVAPKVIRNDGLVDYAGIVIQPDGRLMNMNRFMFDGARTYLDRVAHPYDGVVVNAEYCMMRASDLKNSNSLDETYATLEYAIADMCAKNYIQGKLCVFTPFAEVRQETYRTMLSFCNAEYADSDIALFMKRYGALVAEGDPSHNPNLDPYDPYYQLRDYSPVTADGLRGHLFYLVKRAFNIFGSNGLKNTFKTTRRYLRKR